MLLMAAARIVNAINDSMTFGTQAASNNGLDVEQATVNAVAIQMTAAARSPSSDARPSSHPVVSRLPAWAKQKQHMIKTAGDMRDAAPYESGETVMRIGHGELLAYAIASPGAVMRG